MQNKTRDFGDHLLRDKATTPEPLLVKAVRDWQEGINRQANFTLVYNSVSPLLYGFSQRFDGDFFQDLCVYLAERVLPNFDTERGVKFITYLRHAMNGFISDWIKRTYINKQLPCESMHTEDGDIDVIDNKIPSPEETVDRRHRVEVLADRLEDCFVWCNLSPRERDFLARRMDGETLDDIKFVYNCSKQNVSQTLKRIETAIREYDQVTGHYLQSLSEV